ncbi:MAG: RES domain-containing protein [Rhodospirillales bacterium]|nr:RES domain-containing protein [Rhodospirillales bacterium]
MRFRGLVYRAHNPQWSWTPLSGEGARRYGGRFNRRGMPALYTSLAPLTAIREAQPLGRHMQPLTLCAYEVDAEPVFDTLDEQCRQALGVSECDLACSTWESEMLTGAVPASQALADRLLGAGYVGMRVRSFAAASCADDLNLVMWTWGAALPHLVVLIDDDGRLGPAAGP